MNSATMNGFLIDTLQFSKRMQKAGLQKEVSDELAEALREVQIQSSDNLVTKKEVEFLDQDFRTEIKDLRKDIKILETSLRKDIESLEINLEAKILVKTGKMLYFSTGIIVTAISIAVAILKM